MLHGMHSVPTLALGRLSSLMRVEVLCVRGCSCRPFEMPCHITLWCTFDAILAGMASCSQHTGSRGWQRKGLCIAWMAPWRMVRSAASPPRLGSQRLHGLFPTRLLSAISAGPDAAIARLPGGYARRMAASARLKSKDLRPVLRPTPIHPPSHTHSQPPAGTLTAPFTKARQGKGKGRKHGNEGIEGRVR